MRRFAAIALVLSAVIVVGPAGQAEACSCAILDPAQMLEDSDAAFVGTLIEAPTGTLAPGEFEGIWIFEVEEWVKGDLGPQVGVHSALDGAACGFEMAVGEGAGVFLHNNGGRPTSGLCSVTSPEALLAAAQPLILDGTGPPVFFIAADSGRARLATLDAAGRLLAVAPGDEPTWSVSVCRGESLMVEVTIDGVAVREVSTLEMVEAVTLDDRPEQAWCLDADAQELLVLYPEKGGAGMRLQMLGGTEPLYRGDYNQVVVGPETIVLSRPAGDIELITVPDGDTHVIPTESEPSRIVFSPAGDRLLLSHTTHHSTGGFRTIARIHDVRSGEVQWESELPEDTEILNWVDERRLAAVVYPIDAAEPRDFLLDIESREMTETELAGWEFFPTAAGIASSENGTIYVKPDGRPPAPVTSLPSPNHRLIAVLDSEADIEISGNTTPLTTGSAPSVATEPESDMSPSTVPFILILAGAAVGGTAVALRRRQAD